MRVIENIKAWWFRKIKKETNDRRVAKDYGNDPFFVQKADEAKKTIDKYGFPKELALKK